VFNLQRQQCDMEKDLMEQERARLLQQHAPHLLGHLPPVHTHTRTHTHAHAPSHVSNMYSSTHCCKVLLFTTDSHICIPASMQPVSWKHGKVGEKNYICTLLRLLNV